MKNAVIYIHGKGGNSVEAEHYKNFLMINIKLLALITNLNFLGMPKLNFQSFLIP